MTKIKVIIVALVLANAAQANEEQYDNQYYNRDQCVQQFITEIEDEYEKCIKSPYVSEIDCALTDKEIKERVNTYCGEDKNNYRRKNDRN